MSVVVMLCFARSGGTLLNKCIGSLPDTVVLSEVNPLGGGWGENGADSFSTVRAQAKNWYNLDIKSDEFADGIIELYEICKDTNKRLVVRDWTFVNFVPCEENQWSPPNRFLTLDSLKDNCAVIPFAFIRNAIDVWISRGMPPVNDFFMHYLNYVERLTRENICYFRYEDFCANPQGRLKEICEYANLPYRDVTNIYQAFSKVNGDVQNKSASRGIKQNKIAPLPRKYIPWQKIREIEESSLVRRCNELVGYQSSYFTGMTDRAIWFFQNMVFWYGAAIKSLRAHNILR